MEKELIIRRVGGVITHVIVGYIAAEIPAEWNAERAEIIGKSSRIDNEGKKEWYYDVSLSGGNIVHIWKQDRYIGARPYYLEEKK